MRPARPVRGRDLADLARDDGEPPAVERAAERERDLALTVPAELDDPGLIAGELECGGKPAWRAARMKYEVAILGCRVRRRELDAQRMRQRGARRVDVDERDLAAGK